MLMYGSGVIIKDILEMPETRVYNLASLKEGFPRLNLIPPQEKMYTNTEYEFDVNYMNYIFSNDIVFMNLMTIILELYYGRNVYLLISNDEWSEILTDSLMKLIQQRYGVNGVRIETIEDLQYAVDDTFSDYGIMNLDQDKERFTYIDQKFKMAGAENNRGTQ